MISETPLLTQAVARGLALAVLISAACVPASLNGGQGLEQDGRPLGADGGADPEVAGLAPEGAVYDPDASQQPPSPDSGVADPDATPGARSEAGTVKDPSPIGDVTVVATFESLGIYWSPSVGTATSECKVRYRVSGSLQWRSGLPLWFDARDGQYRGSLVQLAPGTTYVIELSLPDGTTGLAVASTWSDDFPVAKVVELPGSSSGPLSITQSGTASGYVLYRPKPGASATIDVADQADANIVIDASYVIVRGLTLRGASRHGIHIQGSSHDVVIEQCDIAGWGKVESDGWGENYNGAIYAKSSDVERIIIQRNRLHHPRSDSNSWEENGHPRGPQAVVLWDSRGNHVIRYNEIYSDDDHRFNDCMGAGKNRSLAGFPNRDSDIYGNELSHCWDDAIESEGANRNVRIWGNYIDDSYVMVAVASTALGPIYIFRNVVDRSRRNFGDWDDVSRGGLLKTSDTDPSGGKVYLFHNTILQSTQAGLQYPVGGKGLGHGGPMHNVTTRNNILAVYKSSADSINDRNGDPLGDYDYDLYNGDIVAAGSPEAHGIKGTPTYQAPTVFGDFSLAPSSPGYDQGVVLPGFNDGYSGAAPDIGAHEAGAPAMQFGVSGPGN